MRASDEQAPEIIVRARQHIRHLHRANPQGRVFPLRWDDYDYALFFASLRTIKLDKRISVEAPAKGFPGEVPQTIAVLRRAFER